MCRCRQREPYAQIEKALPPQRETKFFSWFYLDRVASNDLLKAISPPKKIHRNKQAPTSATRCVGMASCIRMHNCKPNHACSPAYSCMQMCKDIPRQSAN